MSRARGLTLWVLHSFILSVGGETEGSLRLQSEAGRTNSDTGRLEILLNGQWGTVCSDSFGTVEMNLACNQLGYASLTNSFRAGELGVPVASPSTPIWLSGVDCSGPDDLTIFNCPRDRPVSTTCDHTQDVALTCSGPYSIKPGSVRLVPNFFTYTNSYTAGRVEVFYIGRWGTVCNRNVNRATADQLCADATGTETSAALAYGTAGSSELQFSRPGLESDQIWIQFSCSTLTGPCQRRPLGDTNCAHSQDLAISCLGDGAVRLVSSSSPFERDTGGSIGRLEIYYNGEWGTVCEDGFGSEEATVVCRQLGYNTPPFRFGSVNDFGSSRGSGTIWLDNVNCRGSSQNALIVCDHRGFGVHNCDHSQDVAVSCSSSEHKYIHPVTPCACSSHTNSNLQYLHASTQSDTHTTHIHKHAGPDNTIGIVFSVIFGAGGPLCVIATCCIAFCLLCYHCGAVKSRRRSPINVQEQLPRHSHAMVSIAKDGHSSLPAGHGQEERTKGKESGMHPQAEIHDDEAPPSYDVATSYPLAQTEGMADTREKSTVEFKESP